MEGGHGGQELLIIGVGNSDRGDDGVGIDVVEELKNRIGPGCSFVVHGGESTSLMETWSAFDGVLLIDATKPGPNPGKVRRFDVARSPLPADHFALSSHSCGVPGAIELARALGRLPACFVVAGIETHSVDYGNGLSPELRRHLPAVIEEIFSIFKNIEQVKGRNRHA